MTEETTWSTLKCASCYGVLKDPFQLPTCLHIVCFHCKEDNYLNFACLQCSKRNARELISNTEKRLCDYSADHGTAIWNCFECAKNMCAKCHIEHTKGHKVSLLESPEVLEHLIHDGASSGVSIQDIETDGANQENIKCPICNLATCKHVQLLQKLNAGFQECEICCQQQGHVDGNNKRLPLKFFCKMCWTPVCSDCSIGKHKKLDHESHETDDISDCGKKFVAKSLEILYEKLEMLIRVFERDVDEVKVIEKRFQSHVADMDKELNSRKEKIIEQTNNAFDMAISGAASQGRSILTDYRETLNKLEETKSFLNKIKKALRNIDTNLDQAEIAQHIGTYYLQHWANELIQDIYEKFNKYAKFEEFRLVLPEMDAITTPPPCLAQVKTEMKQLKLAFSFKLRDDYSSTNSIVLTGVNECLISYKYPTYETDFDGVVLCHYNNINNSVAFKEYEVKKGRYYLSRLPSGEIVASFSCPKKSLKPRKNKILYFNGNFHNNTEMLFDDVYTFQLEPYGIAATKNSKIILCVNADEFLSEKKMPSQRKNLSQVISMSLRGKILNSTLSQPNANLMKPDYIAVSDSGEVCISDKENSSIVILNEDLTIKERMNYHLPTSIESPRDYKFQPHGVCYDSIGRIIVADPDNNSVVRLFRDPLSHKYILEPLLSKDIVSEFISGFDHPKLVAMSINSQLWVVCDFHVFVFDYGF